VRTGSLWPPRSSASRRRLFSAPANAHCRVGRAAQARGVSTDQMRCIGGREVFLAALKSTPVAVAMRDERHRPGPLVKVLWAREGMTPPATASSSTNSTTATRSRDGLHRGRLHRRHRHRHPSWPHDRRHRPRRPRPRPTSTSLRSSPRDQSGDRPNRRGPCAPSHAPTQHDPRSALAALSAHRPSVRPRRPASDRSSR
jgi:hypothetical protein